MKFGARMIKTGISVSLSLYLAELLNLGPIIFAGIAAALAIQPSLYRSWQIILDQVQSNTIGAILAIIFTMFLGNDPFVVGLVVILVIAVNIQLRTDKSIPLSIVTVVAIMQSTTGNYLLFALERFLLILLGIGSSVLLNFMFLPPRYEDKLYTKLQEINGRVLTYLRTCTLIDIEDKTYRRENTQLKEELLQLEQIYLLYKEERTYLRKMRYSKTRKLVLFRKLIQVTRDAQTVFHQIERHRLELSSIPQEWRQIIIDQLNVLTSYHEKILLKYEGKLKIHHPHLPEAPVVKGKEKVLEQFVGSYQSGQQDKEWINLFPLIAALINYSNHLERLDKLVEGYRSFHAVDKED